MNQNRKLFLEKIAERVYKNILKEANASGSGDVANLQKLALPLVKKVYTNMLTTQLFDVQPTTSPVARIAALFHFYKPDEATTLDGSYIIELASNPGTPLAYNDAITFAGTGFTAVVKYVEPSTKSYLVLMDNVSEVPLITDTVGGIALTKVVPNIAGIKKIFHDYTGPYQYMNDDNSGVNRSAIEIRTMAVETKSRKLKTTLTNEQIQDYFNIYGEDAVELVVNMLGNEIAQEIDMETIAFIKTIARDWGTIDLDLSVGIANDIMSIANDIYANIFLASESILRDTKRNRTMFVLADSTTASLLLTNPLHSAISADDSNNPFLVGKVGTFPLYCDIYSRDNYVVIGYHGVGANDGDSGLIYVPYTDAVLSTPDADTFQNKMMVLRRYALVQHPQDQGTSASGDSDFFVKMAIDLGTTLPAKNFPKKVIS